MQALWDLGGRSILFIVLSGALFGATAGYALATYGRLPRSVAIAVGAVFSIFGVVILSIVVLVRRFGRHSEHPVGERADMAPASETLTGYEGFDDWSSAASSDALVGAETMKTDNSWGFDSWDTVQPPILATPNAASSSAARRTITDRFSTAWGRTPLGRIAAGLGSVAGVLVVVSIFTGWLSINAAIVPRFWVYPIGTGLDIALLVTAVIVGSVVASVAMRPFCSLAVLLAWVADTWLVLMALLVSSREAATYLLNEIGALTLSTGDLLKSVGIDTSAGVVELPQGVDLSSVGVSGRSVDLSGLDLGQIIPDMSVTIGPGVYLIIAFAVLANAAVFVILRAADHAAHAPLGENL